jgi:hypothetical protein
MAVKRPKGKRKPTPKAIGRWDDEGGAPSGGRSRPKRPRDPNQLAKSIVELATGQIKDREPPTAPKKGRKGGLKGGPARAAALDPQKRRQIARKAAAARWAKKPS